MPSGHHGFIAQDKSSTHSDQEDSRRSTTHLGGPETNHIFQQTGLSRMWRVQKWVQNYMIGILQFHIPQTVPNLCRQLAPAMVCSKNFNDSALFDDARKFQTSRIYLSLRTLFAVHYTLKLNCWKAKIIQLKKKIIIFRLYFLGFQPLNFPSTFQAIFARLAFSRKPSSTKSEINSWIHTESHLA